jgi:hypothetical protein
MLTYARNALAMIPFDLCIKGMPLDVISDDLARMLGEETVASFTVTTYAPHEICPRFRTGSH